MSESADDERLSYEDLLLDRDAAADEAIRWEKQHNAEAESSARLVAALVALAKGLDPKLGDNPADRHADRALTMMRAAFDEAEGQSEREPSSRALARALFAPRQASAADVIIAVEQELQEFKHFAESLNDWLTRVRREIRRLRAAEEAAQQQRATLAAHTAALRFLGVELAHPVDVAIDEAARSAVKEATLARDADPRAQSRATDAEVDLASICATLAACDAEWADPGVSRGDDDVRWRIRRWWREVRGAWEALKGRASPARDGSLGDAIRAALRSERDSIERRYARDRQRNHGLRMRVSRLQAELAAKAGEEKPAGPQEGEGRPAATTRDG